RLDTSACAGLWTCDPNLLHCVQSAPPCQNVTNATTMCANGGDAGVGDSGADVTCSWTCNSGYDHIVWTNGVPSQVTSFGSPPPAGGCEYQQTSMTDKPDLSFVDSNCDGIDGTVADAIFVDTVTGLDTNAGTITSPVKTIGEGIILAFGASPKKDVYVSKGGYAETITMASGVSIYGGYDASNMWQRSNANVTTITGGSIAVTAKSSSTAQDIQ